MNLTLAAVPVLNMSGSALKTGSYSTDAATLSQSSGVFNMADQQRAVFFLAVGLGGGAMTGVKFQLLASRNNASPIYKPVNLVELTDPEGNPVQTASISPSASPGSDEFAYVTEDVWNIPGLIWQVEAIGGTGSTGDVATVYAMMRR